MPLVGARQADRQEDRADQHMETMEAGRHEEGRAIDMASKTKGGMAIFIGLHTGEQRAKNHGQPEALLQALAIAIEQRVMRPGHRGARGQQDQCVEERQMPGIEDFDALGWPGATKLVDAGELNGLVGIDGSIEIGPEPGDEEHHLGGNEHHHAVAMMDLHDAGVIALMGFHHHVLPPEEHCGQHADEARSEQDGAKLQASQRHGLHGHHGTNRHDEGRDRAREGPGGGGNQVVIVVLGMGFSHALPRWSCQKLSCHDARSADRRQGL